MYSGKFFTERINKMAYSLSLNRTALAGDSGIKIVDMGDFNEITNDTIKLTDTEASVKSVVE